MKIKAVKVLSKEYLTLKEETVKMINELINEEHIRILHSLVSKLYYKEEANR